METLRKEVNQKFVENHASEAKVSKGTVNDTRGINFWLQVWVVALTSRLKPFPSYHAEADPGTFNRLAQTLFKRKAVQRLGANT